MTDVEPELPRAIALAWGVAANPQRGPKRELSIERIVDAAIELADAGGLQAVSMASVAASLGFTTMSLYRYVTAKDDLVLLMQDQAIGVPPETVREAAAEGWRAGTIAWADALLEIYRRHSWILDVKVVGTTTTPGNAAWLDTGLAVLASTNLTEVEKVAVSLSILAHTRWQALIERGYLEEAAARGARPDDLDADQAAMMRALITPEAFPALAEALDAGAFDDPDADPFGFGLATILDGVERHLERGPAPLPRPAPHDPPAVDADKRVREAQKGIREAEKALREARKREREARKAARERLRSDH